MLKKERISRFVMQHSGQVGKMVEGVMTCRCAPQKKKTCVSVRRRPSDISQQLQRESFTCRLQLFLHRMSLKMIQAQRRLKETCRFNFKTRTLSRTRAVCGAVKVVAVALSSDGLCVTELITRIGVCWPPCCRSTALFVLVPQA